MDIGDTTPQEGQAGSSSQPTASAATSQAAPGQPETSGSTVASSRPIDDGNIQTAAAAALGAAAVKAKVGVCVKCSRHLRTSNHQSVHPFIHLVIPTLPCLHDYL